MFGNLPKNIGGQQSTGASIVIWNLAEEINKLNSQYKVIIVATDVYVNMTKISNTEILGWNKKSILTFSLLNPHKVFLYIFYSLLLKVRYNYPFLNTIGKFVFFAKSIIFLKYDIKYIHIHGDTTFMIIKYLLNFYKFKFVLTIHGTGGFDKYIWEHRSLFKSEKLIASLSNINKIVFVSSQIESEYRLYYKRINSPSTIILNGVDKNVFYFNENILNDSCDKITLLTIGGISSRKGQNRVIDALCSLEQKDKNKFRYVVIGVGSQNDIALLKYKAKTNNICFEYLGYKTPIEVACALHNADFMILPSSSEGFGLVFIESIACGTPVIIPKYLPLALEKNILNITNAIYIEDESIASIKTCLINLQPHKYTRKEVSNTVNLLSWENIANQYIEIFNGL